MRRHRKGREGDEQTGTQAIGHDPHGDHIGVVPLHRIQEECINMIVIYA
jgi:hypothetical protein